MGLLWLWNLLEFRDLQKQNGRIEEYGSCQRRTNKTNRTENFEILIFLSVSSSLITHLNY